jgi:hypothetical protein
MKNAEGVPAESRWLSASRDTTGTVMSWDRHPGRGAGNSYADCPVVVTTGYEPTRLRRVED